ncbi:MAG TPA: ATP-binding protein [Thermomicrobiales bacterium]|jgi:signal transduction histidine kinase
MPLTHALRAQLRAVPLFADLTDDRMDCLEPGEAYWLEPGVVNTAEGATATHFFVVLEGEILITKRIDAGQAGRVDIFGPGVFYGELPLLLGTGYPASGTALRRCHLFRLDRDAFMRLLTLCPEVLGGILQTLASRVHVLEQFAQGREKLAALGTLAAGLAHELNNPAAAAQRAADQLRDAVHRSQAGGLALGASLNPEEFAFLAAFQGRLQEASPTRSAAARRVGTVDRGDREAAAVAWLGAHGVVDPWGTASALLDVGLDVATLETLVAHLAAGSVPAAVAWLTAALTATELIGTIAHSSGRIAALVGAIKEYAYLDRGPTQEIDLHEGIENTLLILGHRLKEVTLVREYDRALPRIAAHGSALNQVWANLLDNAIDATAGRGRIRIRTAREGDRVLVEIADDGIGIPPAIRGRIFEPFFTTKGVGAGTGLGLDISYRIVVREHGGDLQVDSSPGETRFRVWLPLGTATIVGWGST